MKPIIALGGMIVALVGGFLTYWGGLQWEIAVCGQSAIVVCGGSGILAPMGMGAANFLAALGFLVIIVGALIAAQSK